MRDDGHDVLWASETMAGQDDYVLLARAFTEQRLILTSDMDFGELVYHKRLPARGVVLMRMDETPVRARITRLQTVWIAIANSADMFVVITEHKTRVRPLPAIA